MTELEKYELVNKCETALELSNAVETIFEGGEVEGRTRNFDLQKTLIGINLVINEDFLPNVITRKYGIRQQALYIKFYQHF